MRRVALIAARLVVAGVFIVAGALKLRDPLTFTNDIANYQLWPALAPLLAAVLPAVEVVVGLALLVLGARWRRAAALCAAAMMVVFTAAAGTAVARGLDVACGCFGSAGGAVGWTTIARDLALLAAAGAIVVLDRRS
jgi:putative oxidoreductase